MKINFLIPPPEKGKAVERIFGCNYGFFSQHNVLMLYPATVLKQNGFDVKVTDCVADGIEDLKSFIKRDDCRVYVFYTNFLSRELDKKSARLILGVKDAKIVFIGSDPSYKPEQYLMNENCFVIRGESEEIILKLIKSLIGILQDLCMNKKYYARILHKRKILCKYFA